MEAAEGQSAAVGGVRLHVWPAADAVSSGRTGVHRCASVDVRHSMLGVEQQVHDRIQR